MLEQLTPDMVTVLVVLAVTIVLFVTEVVRVDVAAILVMVAIGLLGLVPPMEVFEGFASNAVISIIAVMILGAGLDRVGVMRDVAAGILRISGRTERRVLASTSGAVAGISAFMQNIGAAALFLPVIERVSDRTGIPSSRLLMPMGFAAILGGTLTLVASGPLILLNDLLAQSADTLGRDIEPFGLFAPTPIGLALVVAGTALFALAGRWLLPDRSGGPDGQPLPGPGERHGLSATLRAVHLPPGHALVGRTIEEVEGDHPGVIIAAIDDGGDLDVNPPRDVALPPDATLALTGTDDGVAAFTAEHRLTDVDAERFAPVADDEHVGLAEAVVRPGGAADGRHVRDLALRATTGLAVAAVHQRGATSTERVRDHRLSGGDVLVVRGPWEAMGRLSDRGLVPLDEHPTTPPRTDRRWWALGWFAVSLTLVVATDLPLSLALMVGAAGLLVTGVLTADEAYRAVSWKTVFLLAALIPLGRAVEDTGTAAWIADGVIGAAGDLPTWAILAVIGLLTTVFTLVVSNVGATVLLVPLAANVAVGVDADPATFAMMVAIAASNAFLLPTHQVNALLMGPGGYRVADYLRAGGLISVLFLVLAVPLVSLFA